MFSNLPTQYAVITPLYGISVFRYLRDVQESYEQDVDSELYSKTFPSLMSLHKFCMPDRYRAGVHAVSKTSHNAANDKLRDGICTGLQRSSN